MAGDSFHYEKDGNEFVLVHQVYDLDSNPEEFYRGKEVAIGFTYDPSADRGIKFTTHRHGSPETVEKWAIDTRFALHRSRFKRDYHGTIIGDKKILESMLPHTISTDQWDVEDLNRIISTTGYLEVVLRKMGINLNA